MISIVVYGRNDQHGYNMHKRVGLSLNAFASVLDGTGEIIFVDYATPWPLPTLPEAIADTLTDECRRRLRVIRVPESVHRETIGDSTHLFVSEPLARNIGIRRARSENEWILNTNTDMLLSPIGGGVLLPDVQQLTEDYYGIPRYELPEWLWERLDRKNPEENLRLLDEWSRRLCLDEDVLGHAWNLFDGPGDFQLVRRQVMEAIRGFDESMILGWHVDSNLSRRFLVHGSKLGSLEERVVGYHCNHNRTATLVAARKAEGNSLERYFLDVRTAVPEGQSEVWGLASHSFEEISLEGERLGSLLRAAQVDPERHAGRPAAYPWPHGQRFFYDCRHVLPYVLDSVTAAAPGSVVGYVGVGATMRRELQRATADLGYGFIAGSPRVTAREADLVVMDFGIGIRGPDEARDRSVGANLLEQIMAAVAEIRRADSGSRPHLVLVEAVHGYLGEWVAANFIAAPSTLTSAVAYAEVRDESLASEDLDSRIQSALGWLTREPVASARYSEQGQVLVLDASENRDGFDDAWDRSDPWGVLMKSSGAKVLIRRAPYIGVPLACEVVLRRVEPAYAGEARALSIRLFLDDDEVASEVLESGSAPVLLRGAQRQAGPVSPVSELRIEAVYSDGSPYDPDRESVPHESGTWLRVESAVLYRADSERATAAAWRFTADGYLIPAVGASDEAVSAIHVGLLAKLEEVGRPRALLVQFANSTAAVTEMSSLVSAADPARYIAPPDSRAPVVARDQVMSVDVIEPLKVAEPVAVSPRADLPLVFGSGWSAVEEFGVWSESRSAEMWIALTESSAPQLDLVLEVSGLCDRGDSVPAAIRVDGDRHEVLLQRRPCEVRIPLPDGREASAVSVRFEVERLRSPADLDGSPDDRSLGVFLSGVEICRRSDPSHGARVRRRRRVRRRIRAVRNRLRPR